MVLREQALGIPRILPSWILFVIEMHENKLVYSLPILEEKLAWPWRRVQVCIDVCTGVGISVSELRKVHGDPGAYRDAT